MKTLLSLTDLIPGELYRGYSGKHDLLPYYIKFGKRYEPLTEELLFLFIENTNHIEPGNGYIYKILVGNEIGYGAIWDVKKDKVFEKV